VTSHRWRKRAGSVGHRLAKEPSNEIEVDIISYVKGAAYVDQRKLGRKGTMGLDDNIASVALINCAAGAAVENLTLTWHPRSETRNRAGISYITGH